MSNYEITETHADTLSSFGESTPIEIRFHANFGVERHYQMLASASDKGVVFYTLHYNPRGNYSMALTYISASTEKNPVTLPLKAYSGWQKDVLAWIGNMKHYTIDEVF
jgi:hypothetical protein